MNKVALGGDAGVALLRPNDLLLPIQSICDCIEIKDKWSFEMIFIPLAGYIGINNHPSVSTLLSEIQRYRP